MAFEIVEYKPNGQVCYRRKCDCGWSESSVAQISPPRYISYKCPKCGKKNTGTVTR